MWKEVVVCCDEMPPILLYELSKTMKASGYLLLWDPNLKPPSYKAGMETYPSCNIWWAKEE
jgi:hypothetical protein